MQAVAQACATAVAKASNNNAQAIAAANANALAISIEQVRNAGSLLRYFVTFILLLHSSTVCFSSSCAFLADCAEWASAV